MDFGFLGPWEGGLTVHFTCLLFILLGVCWYGFWVLGSLGRWSN